MEERTLAAFIKYAKEKFGYDISLKPSSTPDSFKSIFGESFPEHSDNSPLFWNISEKTMTYNNVETKTQYSTQALTLDYDILSDLGTAA